MSMKIKYFSWVRERVGVDEEIVDLPDGIKTLGDLLAWQSERGENYAAAFGDADFIRIAADMKHVTDLSTSLSGISAFEATPDNGLYPFAALYLVICFFSVAVWAFAGERVSDLVSDQAVLKWLNRLLGILLVAVALYLFYLQVTIH